MTRWGKLGLPVCMAVLLFGVNHKSKAELITFEVVPAFAPNGPAAEGWTNYVLNAIAGIQNGQDIGMRDSNPAAYQRVDGPFPPEEIIFTQFPSWRGTADPEAPFDGQLGNRVHFGLRIVGEPGWKFALDDLTWEMDSDDADDFFDEAGTFQGARYSSTRVGIDYGPDNKRGGPDDRILDGNEPGTTEVNELVYVGVGDGFFSMNPEAMTNQDDIDTTLGIIRGNCDEPGGCFVDITTTYSLPDPHTGGTVSASGTATLFVVPEPTSAVLALLGLGLAVAQLRRRR